MIQLSNPYWKTQALTIQSFVSKVMSLLFNTLSRFDSFPSKGASIFNLRAADMVSSKFWSPRKKSITALTFTFSSSIHQEVIRPDAVILVFLI